MKIMFISDLHYSSKSSEIEAFKWLKKIVKYHMPEYLLSAGDWGYEVDMKNFIDILNLTKIYTIYGNHDNLKVLLSLRNVDDTPILIKDECILKIGELNIVGINGIIAERRRMRKGVPRKRPEDFIRIARSIDNKNIDILLIHESPPFPEYRGSMHFRRSLNSILDVIRILKPRIIINGHLHFSPYTAIYCDKYIYIRIISSQDSRYYAIYDDEKIKIYCDFSEIVSLYW